MDTPPVRQRAMNLLREVAEAAARQDHETAKAAVRQILDFADSIEPTHFKAVADVIQTALLSRSPGVSDLTREVLEEQTAVLNQQVADEIAQLEGLVQDQQTFQELEAYCNRYLSALNRLTQRASSVNARLGVEEVMQLTHKWGDLESQRQLLEERVAMLNEEVTALGERCARIVLTE